MGPARRRPSSALFAGPISDTELDIHSPQKGFWWSHVGWILSDKYDETRFDQIKDFARFPENHRFQIPP